MKVVGFTFIHNGIEGGYPFVEAIEAVDPYVDYTVAIDMESTDETVQVLKKIGVDVVPGKWLPGTAGRCLKDAHAQHMHIDADIIWHFEADEVFDPKLAGTISQAMRDQDVRNIEVLRLQVEQNFQRVRWYPEYVHRVFPPGSVFKEGHTTDRADGICLAMGAVDGFLWDVTNCFRDDWKARYRNQWELWGGQPAYRWVGAHASYGFFNMLAGHPPTDETVDKLLDQPHWTWSDTPLALPENLHQLVGYVSYRDRLVKRGLL